MEMPAAGFDILRARAAARKEPVEIHTGWDAA